MKKNFFIIGSNSFSGSNMIKFLLTNNHKVVGVSRSEEYNEVFLTYKNFEDQNNFNFFQLDLNSNVNEIVNLIKKHQPEYVINFAALGMVAESWAKPADWFQTNVVGQLSFMMN